MHQGADGLAAAAYQQPRSSRLAMHHRADGLAPAADQQPRRAGRQCMHQCADGLTDAADQQPLSSRSGWHQADALELRWGVEVRMLTTRGRRSSSVALADRPAHRLADKRPRQSIGQPIADKRPRKSIGQPIGSFLPM